MLWTVRKVAVVAAAAAIEAMAEVAAIMAVAVGVTVLLPNLRNTCDSK